MLLDCDSHSEYGSVRRSALSPALYATEALAVHSGQYVPVLYGLKSQWQVQYRFIAVRRFGLPWSLHVLDAHELCCDVVIPAYQ